MDKEVVNWLKLHAVGIAPQNPNSAMWKHEHTGVPQDQVGSRRMHQYILFGKKNKEKKKKIGSVGNQTALDLLSEVASIACRIGRS